MSHGTCDSLLQSHYFFFFFFFWDPLKLKRHGPLQKYVLTEIRARTLVRPGTKTERKALLRNPLVGFK